MAAAVDAYVAALDTHTAAIVGHLRDCAMAADRGVLTVPSIESARAADLREVFARWLAATA